MTAEQIAAGLTKADSIDARIAELEVRGWDWHSAYRQAKTEQHAQAAARALVNERERDD